MISKDSEKTRKLILSEAFKLVHRNGFRSTGLRDILLKTKLTKGAFYHHFSNKMALGYAIVDELLDFAVSEYWIKPLNNYDDPIEGIKETFRNVKVSKVSVQFGCPLNNLSVEMAPIDEGFRIRIERTYQKWIDGYADALERGKKTGNVSSKIDSGSSASFIVSTLAGCRSVAKNAKSVGVLENCLQQLGRYLDTLRA